MQNNHHAALERRRWGGRRTLRFVGLSAAVALMAPLIAACGASSEEEATEEEATLPTSELYPAEAAQELNDSLDWLASSVEDPESPVTITVAHSWSPGDYIRQQQFDHFFQQRHPNIRIVSENAGDSSADYLLKYESQAAGGSLPDVMFMHFGFVQSFVSADLLSPLDDYMAADDSFHPEDFTDVSTVYYEKDGENYAVPYDAGPVVIMYNKDIFDQYGVGYPTPDWTFDDLKNAIIATTGGEGPDKTWGLSYPVTPTDAFWDPVRLAPLGGHYLNEDETEVLINEPASVAAVKWWMDMYFEHGVWPSPTELAAMTQADAFTSGRAAMRIDGSWGIPALREQATFKWAVADYPAGPVAHTTAAPGSAYSITANSENKDAAWIYLNEFTSSAGQIFMYASTGKGNMSRVSTWPTYLDSEFAPEGADAVLSALETYATSDGIVYGPAAPELRNASQPVWDQLMAGDLTVDEATAKLAEILPPILAASSE